MPTKRHSQSRFFTWFGRTPADLQLAEKARLIQEISTSYSLPYIVPLIAACDARIRHSAQNKVAELLQQQEPSYWAVLDEKIRSNLYRYHSKLFYPWYQLTIQELNGIIADSNVPEVIIQLLCCHRDGYIREAAVQRMTETPALFLAPLLIRANDWVTKVKLLAYGAIWSCMDQLANTDWVGYLQLIERLRYQSRHNHRDLLLAIEQKFRNNHSLGRLGKDGAGMIYLPCQQKHIIDSIIKLKS